MFKRNSSFHLVHRRSAALLAWHKYLYRIIEQCACMYIKIYILLTICFSLIIDILKFGAYVRILIIILSVLFLAHLLCNDDGFELI